MANWEVTTAGAKLEYDTDKGVYQANVKMDDNHFVCHWQGTDNDGFIQAFEVNTTTWAVSTANSVLEHDTQLGQNAAGYKIDDTHLLLVYQGVTNLLAGQVFAVNTTTWAVTTAAARATLDANASTQPSMCQMDENHFIVFYYGSGADGYARIITVNTSNWTVSAEAALEFDTQNGYSHSCYAIDSTHVINFWKGGGSNTDGYAQVFAVNTTTWAVTTAANSLNYETQSANGNSCYMVDENHFINFYAIGAGHDASVEVFEVNTTTWAVTTKYARLNYDSANNYTNSALQVDTNHFINFWRGSSDNNGFVQVFEVNTSTWEVTTAAASLEFDTVYTVWTSANQIDSEHYICFWSGEDADGMVQTFAVDVPSGAATAVKDVIYEGFIPQSR